MKKPIELFLIVPIVIITIVSLVLFVAGGTVKERQIGGVLFGMLIVVCAIAAIRVGKIIGPTAEHQSKSENPYWWLAQFVKRQSNPTYYWILVAIYFLIAAIIFFITFCARD